MRIVTYNVRYFGHGTRGLASTRRGVHRIAQALASLQPLADLVCLQEVEAVSFRSTVAHPEEGEESTQLARLMRALDRVFHESGRETPYEAFYFPAHRYQLGKVLPFYTTGLAVLAHRDLEVEHVNDDAPHDITHRGLHPVVALKQTRICAHVRVKRRKGAPLDVFNTHLSLPSTFSKDFWTKPRRLGYGPNQLEEARTLASFVDEERASDRFVVVGDFNALPGSPVYRYLVGERGYKDALADVHALDENALQAWPTAGFMALRMHLDHIFSGPALRWVDFEGSHRFGERGARFHGLSDHVPLVGRCDLGTEHPR